MSTLEPTQTDRCGFSPRCGEQRPPQAFDWQSIRLLIELGPEAAEQQEMLLALSENMAAMHEHGMLIEQMTEHPFRDQLGFVHAIAGTRHPDRIAMLTAISHDHPEHDIAAAANEALGSGRQQPRQA